MLGRLAVETVTVPTAWTSQILRASNEAAGSAATDCAIVTQRQMCPAPFRASSFARSIDLLAQ